ncbi:CZB domain-containing protein [Hydrogenobacter sp. T-2]|uniref:CZB domain-containing protein n=1 Tax=Pampinifervens diazotrophicum TaxID=1632018 RepID=UPI002B2590F9|nr:CZB domain-containing protein [Hydrogenobacter sp. T-2]WPM32629.1 CZB domain-containing protein [Hydrogenobacter sp. T-2]
MVGIISLLRDLDIYLSQHAIYISKLERAIESCQPFEHKTCRECAFGKRFYEEVYPYMEEYEDNIKEMLHEIEKLHCHFHEIASRIDTQNPKPEDVEIIKKAKEDSTHLFQLLLALKREILK